MTHGAGICSTSPMRRLSGLMPGFSSMIASAVVLNCCAMRFRMSPGWTVYVTTAGASDVAAGVGGAGAGVALGVGAAVALDADSRVGAAVAVGGDSRGGATAGGVSVSSGAGEVITGAVAATVATGVDSSETPWTSWSRGRVMPPINAPAMIAQITAAITTPIVVSRRFTEPPFCFAGRVVEVAPILLQNDVL
jgi:hypothetical protein